MYNVMSYLTLNHNSLAKLIIQFKNKLEKMNLTSKQHAKIKESLSNNSTLNFIKLAGEWKIAEEAFFVVAIAELPAGAELLKYFKALEAFSTVEDDLKLAYSIYVCYKAQMFKSNDFHVLKLFGEVSAWANSMQKSFEMMQDKNWGHVICGQPYNRLKDQTYQIRPPRHQYIAKLRQAYVISALQNAFTIAFGDTNMFYILRSGVALSMMHSKETTISKKSIIQMGDADGPAVAFKLRHKRNRMKAHFIHRMSAGWERRGVICAISEHRVRMAPLLAEELVHERPDFFKQLTGGECAFISGYNGNTSLLTIICSDSALIPIQEYVDRRIQSIMDSEINWNVLRGRIEDYKTLVLFGSGLRVIGLDNSSSTDSQTSTIRIPLDGADAVAFLVNVEDLVKHFCLYKLESCYAPLRFIFNKSFYATFNSAADRLAFTDTFKTQFPNVEIVQEGIFEYFMSSDECGIAYFNNNTRPGGDPLECVNCYQQLDSEDGDGWVQLLFCGHFVCDNCFIHHFNTTSQFPVKCVAECNRIISIRDMKVVFSRNFHGPCFNNFLLSALKRSLTCYLRENVELVRCKSPDCRHLLRIDPNNQNELDHPAVFCTECKQDRCIGCGDDLHKHSTCYQHHYAKMSVFEPKLIQWIKESNQRRFCPNPNCYHSLERERLGCNHFHCTSCQFHFCWLCENFKATSSGPVYAHLQAAHGGFGIDEAQILQLEARLEGQFLRGWDFPDWVEDDPALLEAIMQVQDPFRIDEDRFGAYNVGQERILYNVYRARYNQLQFLW